MKKMFLTLGLCCAISVQANAATINGIDFYIPDTWELVHETEDGATVAYNHGDEYVTIPVQEQSASTAELEGLLIIDCDTVLGEYEGYYLMTNEREEKDGHLIAAQECVYKMDGGDWFYAYSGSRFYDDHIEVILYQAPTDSSREMFYDFGILFNDHIVG